MDQKVRHFTAVGAVCMDEIRIRAGGTLPPSLGPPIAAEPLSERPFVPHMSGTLGDRHPRLVPDPAAADDGLTPVRHLPTQIPTQEEHDGDEREDRGVAAPEVDQGTRPRTDGEREEQERRRRRRRRPPAASSSRAPGAAALRS